MSTCKKLFPSKLTTASNYGIKIKFGRELSGKNLIFEKIKLKKKIDLKIEIFKKKMRYVLNFIFVSCDRVSSFSSLKICSSRYLLR